MFEQISESFRLAVSKIRFVDDEKALKNALDVLKKALLKADVHHKVTKDLVKFNDYINSSWQSRLCLCTSCTDHCFDGWLAR